MTKEENPLITETLKKPRRCSFHIRCKTYLAITAETKILSSSRKKGMYKFSRKQFFWANFPGDSFLVGNFRRIRLVESRFCKGRAKTLSEILTVLDATSIATPGNSSGRLKTETFKIKRTAAWCTLTPPTHK